MTRTNRRGPWLPEEDRTLLDLVQSQGPNNWVRISQHMLQRSPKQCRERYHQNLKPSLNHDPITAREGEIIEQLVNELGKRWADIARRLGNRSDNAVKNWWNGSVNRRKRNVASHGSGLKSVGHRNHPISATKSSKPTSHSTDSRRLPSVHEYRRSQSWQETGPYSDRLSRPMPSYAEPSQPGQSQVGYPLSSPQQVLGNQLPPLSHLAPSHPNPVLYEPQSYHQLIEPSLRPSYYSFLDRTVPPKLLLSAQRPHEAPLVSPATTDVSHAPSYGRAPSLVSDSQSAYSISPKTVPSPRPDMPAPIDTNVHPWEPQFLHRRVSLPHIPPQQHMEGKMPHDEGYVSALPVSARSDSKLTLPLSANELSRQQSLDQPLQTHRYSTSSSSNLLPHTPTSTYHQPSQSPRDTRMNVSNLLG